MERIKVEIKGISPLLMNRFIDRQIEGTSKKRTGGPKELDITEKLWIYDNKICIPSVYFRNCLIESAKQFKITGKGKSTYSKLVGATVNINPDMIILTPQKYNIFSISAVNPMTKGRVIVKRPRFEEWGASFEIILEDDSIKSDVLNEMLTYGGRYVGVGDWRPDKKGMFGKFMISSFKVY